ncbi:hypothetical protein [Rhodoferax sp.]|uniref:hypothetical protein n=1 Tax=Rhodoferax sp. TaxID=50421 RepID=UPI00262D14E5|nr:hypothetical protein [Rhodoferax sp.]MDD2809671.1 hypothetical protein [Rhodoferax sp.]
MTDSTPDASLAVFGKTALGQQEIQSRALGLNPLTRRVLILIDGKRKYQELATLTGVQNLAELLNELVAKGCIEVTATLAAASSKASSSSSASPQKAATSKDDLAQLPPAETRTFKQAEMAKNFMMNTVNTVFQQNTRLTLLEAIFGCKTPQEVRRVYPKWVETMEGSVIGAKRLPEFREKLFQVL